MLQNAGSSLRVTIQEGLCRFGPGPVRLFVWLLPYVQCGSGYERREAFVPDFVAQESTTQCYGRSSNKLQTIADAVS